MKRRMPYAAKAVFYQQVLVGCLVLAACPLPLGAAEADTPVLSVCQLLKNLPSHREKKVRVRAMVAGSQRHGSFLTDVLEERWCPGLRKWPPAIEMVWPTQLAQAEGPMDFVPQKELLRQIWSRINDHAPDLDKRKVTAVFVGKIESRKGIRILTYQDGGERIWAGDGYGQGGQYPAQLVIETMTDVWVEYEGQRKRIDEETVDK